MPCSYCHLPGHTIRNCDDSKISNNAIAITNIFIHAHNNYITTMEKWDYFRRNVSSFHGGDIKAVALRYPDYFIRCTKNIMISFIWDKLCSGLYVPHPHRESRVVMPRVPDVIPVFAQDLDVNISWSIDRTPDVNLAAICSQNKFNIELVIEMKKEEEEEEEEEECAICYDKIKTVDEVMLNCGHTFCGLCIKTILTNHNNMRNDPCCALCRKDMSKFVVKNQEIYNLVSEYCEL